MKPTLRVLAVTAPHWPKRPIGIEICSFTAGSPFSLQNAVRQAAGCAKNKVGAWADSNWTTLEQRQSSVLLLEFMDEARVHLATLLPELKPNIVLIGAMTLGFPGAVEIAQQVREMFGEDCLIVLGGKHVNETLRRTKEEVQILSCCPLELMKNKTISEINGLPLFDLVISGDGEDVVTVFGEIVHSTLSSGRPLRDAFAEKNELRRAGGQWIAGWVEEGEIGCIVSAGASLNFDIIPTAPAIFGLQSRFPVFDAPTGHAYSDMGRGCRYNCFFCSERSALNGKLQRSNYAVDRLIQHLEDIWIAGGSGRKGNCAAFIEDSILLGGNSRLIEEFVDKLKVKNFKSFKFGCQLTVNDIEVLKHRGLLQKLAGVGCDYVAFGMETVNEGVATRMSKHNKLGLWSEASRCALKFLKEAKIRSGVFVLWGLGESQLEREHQLQQLINWKIEYDGPCSIGLNWATLHPGANINPTSVSVTKGDMQFWFPSPTESVAKRTLPDFLEWGASESSDRFNIFVEIFGEASEKYQYYYDIQMPTKNELEKLRSLFFKIIEN